LSPQSRPSRLTTVFTAPMISADGDNSSRCPSSEHLALMAA
jgi:hypothetical protein